MTYKDETVGISFKYPEGFVISKNGKSVDISTPFKCNKVSKAEVLPATSDVASIWLDDELSKPHYNVPGGITTVFDKKLNLWLTYGAQFCAEGMVCDLYKIDCEPKRGILTSSGRIGITRADGGEGDTPIGFPGMEAFQKISDSIQLLEGKPAEASCKLPDVDYSKLPKLKDLKWWGILWSNTIKKDLKLNVSLDNNLPPNIGVVFFLKKPNRP